MLASVQPAASPPATMNPSTCAGGYVIGTLEIPTVAPCWLSNRHIVEAWFEPEWATRGGSCGVLSKKPNTPCRPGFTPVAIETHAGGVYEGIVDRRIDEIPRRRMLPSAGMTPERIKGSSTRKVAPSRPMMAVLLNGPPPRADDPSRTSRQPPPPAGEPSDDRLEGAVPHPPEPW